MLLIVFFHASRSVTANTIISKSYNAVIGMWGLLGVDLFVIISAYFLVEQKFKLIRIIDVVLRTGSYIIFSTILCLGWNIYKTGSVGSPLMTVIKYHINAFFDPLWTNQYWFVTAYIFMVLLSPLLNYLLNKLENKQVLYILLFFCFVPVIANFGGYNKVNDIMNFLYMYLLVGYLKRIDFKIKSKSLVWICPCVATLTLIVGKFITTIDSENKIFILVRLFVKYTFGNYGRHSLFILIDALLIFNLVLSLKPFCSKPINAVSKHTFGVYLFHENPMFNICDMVICKGFELGFIKDGILFIPTYTGAVVAIFLVGLMVDVCYEFTVHKNALKLVQEKLVTRMKRVDEWINREYGASVE